MRNTVLLNDNWTFQKPDCPAEAVTLPHTWNAKDGTDGGNDYYRGTCTYTRALSVEKPGDGSRVYVEFRGAAHTCQVFLGGEKLCRHEGGYSTFRVDLTDHLTGSDLLTVTVDNGKNDRVYPQKADFTFYGGLYRDVYLITVPAAHFALEHHGGSGLKITPHVSEDLKSAVVTAEAWVEGGGREVTFCVAGQTVVSPVEDGKAKAVFTIENVHLWDGVNDPWLYVATAQLDSGDAVCVRFGCRSIAFDAEKGFILNGQPYRLCGAARHQDREGLGNALTRKEHDEDMALLLEMGANTVRLAHYQHDQYFYDLCDEKGLIVWAEIPYITEHLENGVENTLSQMTELIVQNYNHPSIVCWGLSNEITASGGVTESMVQNHRALNDLCHKLDSTRPTTMAHVFMLDPDDPFVLLPDIRSYNLYYGWYVGELEQNDQFFDEFHAKHPEAVIGLSEFGADANPAYQSSKPERSDYTESYQCLYHEHLLKMWAERPYIWAMHCWNMFDFGADGRDEGGKPGQNQKGLITFDRKTKKDAFYLYKAYLSKEPFVHLCGSRYVNRAEEETEIKVYSNQPSVTLLVDGQAYAVQNGDKVFTFTVPITGEHKIEAKAGEWSDSITIRKVSELDRNYVKDGGEVVNWFDKPEELTKEGYYSILDSMAELKKSPQAAAILEKIMAKAKAGMGDVAQNVQMPEAIQKQMDAMPLQKLLQMAGKSIGRDIVSQLNGMLNQIPRE